MDEDRPNGEHHSTQDTSTIQGLTSEGRDYSADRGCGLVQDANPTSRRQVCGGYGAFSRNREASGYFGCGLPNTGE